MPPSAAARKTATGDGTGRCMTHELWTNLNTAWSSSCSPSRCKAWWTTSGPRAAGRRQAHQARHLQPACAQAHPRDGAWATFRPWAVCPALDLDNPWVALTTGPAQLPYGHDPHFPIYLDYGATTPCDHAWSTPSSPGCANTRWQPASRSQCLGLGGRRSRREGPRLWAELIGADPREIVWTSGATESNNLAIRAPRHFYQSRGQAPDHRQDRAQGRARHHASWSARV